MQKNVMRILVRAIAILVCSLAAHDAAAQGLGSAGTIQGIVKDPTGSVMQAVDVTIRNPVSGFSRTATTDTSGSYTFRNLPFNPYHLSIAVDGFQAVERDVEVRTAVPITLDFTLHVATTIS